MLMLSVATPGRACINETGTDRFGRPVYLDMPVDDLRHAMTYGARRVELVEWAHRIVEQSARSPNYDNLNQLAVVTMRLGRPKAAIRLLLALERRYPGHYETATNLGTALELAGENAQALRWIREGIRRNPMSHEGSEWLHVRILQAKLAATPTPTGSVLGLDFGVGIVPALPRALPRGNDGRPLAKPGELSQHIVTQLNERVQFVPPRDPIVAGLFFDWGNNEMASGALEYADLAYDFALRYGYPDAALVARRRQKVAQLLADTR
jgi:tetratricopeptide (TPR) repeat protein